jgi:hypothetical protein
MTAAELIEWIDPEIAALEAELAAVGEDLAGAEAALAEARELLRVFTRAHDRILGPLHAELDEIEARIAETCAAASGSPDDLRDARAARDRASESARAADAIPKTETVPPPPEARPLYRGLARNCHPDLAADEADRQRRQAFMIRVNVAYARGDVDLLERLSREWEEADATAPTRDDGPGRLPRLRAAVQAAQRRLAQVGSELEEVTTSGLGVLLFDDREPGLQAALRRLDALAVRLRAVIVQRRHVLADLTRSRA